MKQRHIKLKPQKWKQLEISQNGSTPTMAIASTCK